MGFVVIRHAEGGVGTCPVGALDHFTALGWQRVSDERAEPDMFYLPDFAAPERVEEQPQAPVEPEEEEQQ